MEESEGRKLIRDCIDRLNRILETDNGNNQALYPVVMVFFGTQSAELFPTIKEMLDINWNNAEYLKYLHIVKSENGFQCTNLVTNAKEEDPDVFVEDAIVEMLGTDEYIFEDKTRIRFEYILPGEEDNAKEYYDMMLHMDLGSQYNAVKTMFVMMDERKAENRRKIRELLTYITENREKTKHELGTVYLLSNYLKDGNVLLGYRLNQNYRLVADLVLLGGNKGTGKNNNAVSVIEGYNTIKTAAYALVEKPVRSITIVGLQKIMRYLMEENERIYKETSGDVMQSAEKIQEKLGIQPGRIKCLEELFQESIVRTGVFPMPDEIKYLAYINEQEYKSVHKEKRVSSVRLDRATGENWNLFFEENYIKKIENLMCDEKFMKECMEKIEKSWRSSLSYGDCLYGLEDGRVEDMLETFQVTTTTPARDSVEESIHVWAVEESRKKFYSCMISRLCSLLTRIHQDAKRFEKTYKELEERIKKEVIDEADQNIRSYYEHLTEHFLRGAGAQASADIFRLKSSEEEILSAIIKQLKQVFRDLISSDPIFTMTFEKEMQTRLNTVSDEDRLLMVKGVLEEKIENKVRLHGRDTAYENNIRGIYYLMNKDAEYAKELDTSSQLFTIFHLERTDCIEKIAIYDIDGPNQYSNLAEMAGEA